MPFLRPQWLLPIAASLPLRHVCLHAVLHVFMYRRRAHMEQSPCMFCPECIPSKYKWLQYLMRRVLIHNMNRKTTCTIKTTKGIDNIVVNAAPQGPANSKWGNMLPSLYKTILFNTTFPPPGFGAGFGCNIYSLPVTNPKPLTLYCKCICVVQAVHPAAFAEFKLTTKREEDRVIRCDPTILFIWMNED